MLLEILQNKYNNKPTLLKDVQKAQESSQKPSKVTVSVTTNTYETVESVAANVDSNKHQQQKSQKENKQTKQQNGTQLQYQYKQQQTQAMQKKQSQYQTPSSQHQEHQHHQQQHLQQPKYENGKSSQQYRYPYSSNDNLSHQHPTARPTVWTSSSQHKKSLNTVTGTATPSIIHRNEIYSNPSNITNSSSTHAHAKRTYTEQRYNNYLQQQPRPQTKNCGAMKIPTSPISSVSNSFEFEESHGQQPQQQMSRSTSVSHPLQHPQEQPSEKASATDTIQKQQPSSADPNISASCSTTVASETTTDHHPPGFTKKNCHSGTNVTTNIVATVTNSSNAVESTSTPAINLAPAATNSSTSTTSSWAGLFVNSSNAASPAISNLCTIPPPSPSGTLSDSAASDQNLPTSALPSATTASPDKKAICNEKHSSPNKYSLKFAEFLTKYQTDWATVSLRPRGLRNRSNYCYINSILQALLGCSPLYNLIRSIPKQAANLCEVRTPTINAMHTFMSNFSNLPTDQHLRTNSNLPCDFAFEPTEIYKLWNESRLKQGHQEDAEEFLSFLLNKLNDEMLEITKLIPKSHKEPNFKNEAAEENGDMCQMSNQTDFDCTPLNEIFRGELRSSIQREGEPSTDVIQPFFTLQLNIEKAASVKEALEMLVARNQLEGVTGSNSTQQVAAWHQMNLEKLPPVLILHLKCFNYRLGGCTKITKRVQFPLKLKIDANILGSKRYSYKKRAYRLFAVVYHDGKEVTKGHYITDVYHTGYGSWLRCNDSSVKAVSENDVLFPQTPRVPYLLCYRRCDTIPQQNNNNQNNSSTGSSSS